MKVTALRNLLHEGKVHLKGAVLDLEDTIAHQLHKEGSVDAESLNTEDKDTANPSNAPTTNFPAKPAGDGVEDDTNTQAAAGVEEGGSEDAEAKPAGDGVEEGGAEE